MELTPSRKGAIAEAAVELECAKLGLEVLRPASEGRRYDLVIDNEHRLLRTQVKWARHQGDVICVNTRTSRHTPNGYVRTIYTAAEIDGFAAYCEVTGECYWLPIDEFAGQSQVLLRLAPTLNGQRGSIRWACDYPFGAVVQLEERLHGMQEVAGSSPASSTESESVTLVGSQDFQKRYGWYAERAVRGESILVTKRGRPYLRLVPATPVLPGISSDGDGGVAADRSGGA